MGIVTLTQRSTVWKAFGSTSITNDGVTITKNRARRSLLKIWVLNWSAKWLQTNDIAGDGTTIATVLRAIVREGSKNVTAGVN